MPPGAQPRDHGAPQAPARLGGAILMAVLVCAAALPDRAGTLTIGTETLHLTVPEGFVPEVEVTPAARSVTYVHAIGGDMDVRQGGVQVRGSPIEGSRSLDERLAGLETEFAGRCHTQPAVDELRHFVDAGLPALGALLRCGPVRPGQGGYVIALKLIRGRQAQFVVLRVWQVDASGPAAAMPYTDAMRADATAMLDSAHVCARGTACR